VARHEMFRHAAPKEVCKWVKIFRDLVVEGVKAVLYKILLKRVFKIQVQVLSCQSI